MARTLVKAAVFFLMGALLALGKRHFQQKASLQNISRVVHVLHQGHGLKLQDQQVGDRTKVEELNSAGINQSGSQPNKKSAKMQVKDPVESIKDLQRKYGRLFFGPLGRRGFRHGKCHEKYSESQNWQCMHALSKAAKRLREAWPDDVAWGLVDPACDLLSKKPETENTGTWQEKIGAFFRIQNISRFCQVRLSSYFLATGTWSENMKALLHKYSEDDELVKKIAMLELLPNERGFGTIPKGLDKATAKSLTDLLDSEILKKKNDVKLEALKELWYARQGYLDEAMKQMTQWVAKQTAVLTNSYGFTVKIFPTGSSKLTSDKDVQIAMNLCDAWTEDTIKVLADVVAWIRTVSSGLVALDGSDKNIVLERLYDINFYPPTLFNDIPEPCLGRFLRGRFYHEKREMLVNQDGGLASRYLPKVAFRIQTLAWGSRGVYADPGFLYRAILPFLKIESVRATHNFEGIKTDEFLERWKAETAPQLYQLLDAALWRDKVVSQSKSEDWNLMMLGLTAPNFIGPEMYLSICTILYVAWHMQMGNPIEAQVLPIISIVSALENLVHYKKTSKDKYLERVCHPYINHLVPNGYISGDALFLSLQAFKHVESKVASETTSSEHDFHPAAKTIVKRGYDAMLYEMERLCNSNTSSWSWPSVKDVVQYIQGASFDDVVRYIHMVTPGGPVVERENGPAQAPRYRRG